MWTDRYIDVVGRYLCEVSNIKQVKGFKQFILFQLKPVLTNSQERADVLQAQELNTDMIITITLHFFSKILKHNNLKKNLTTVNEGNYIYCIQALEYSF